MRPALWARWPASTARRRAGALAAGSGQWGRHRGGVGGAEDGAGGEDGVAAELEGLGGVGGGADAGVEDDRDLGALGDDRDVVGGADGGAGADRRAERHHRGAAGLLEAAGEDRVVVRVGGDGEGGGARLFGPR